MSGNKYGIPSGSTFDATDSQVATTRIEQAVQKAAAEVKANALLPREYRKWPVCVGTNQFSVGRETDAYLTAFKQAFADGYEVVCKPVLENTYVSSEIRICVRPK